MAAFLVNGQGHRILLFCITGYPLDDLGQILIHLAQPIPRRKFEYKIKKNYNVLGTNTLKGNYNSLQCQLSIWLC